MSLESAPPLLPGDRVRVRGDGWAVERLIAFDDCARIDLSGLGPGNRGRRTSLLWPFDRPVKNARRIRPRIVTRSRWIRGLRALVLSSFDHDALRVPCTADLDLFPHQLVPALAVVRGHATRILLADDVGLGKTIQAGLVCAELRRRGRGNRILILTPAGLRAQWVDELARRFALEAHIVDAAALGRRVSSLPHGLNPWSPPGIAVVSIDFAKHPEVLGPLAENTWDVLVVDEAHGAAPGSRRAIAAKRLAECARIVLCATATPHSGDDSAFADLCSMGRLAGEGPVLLVRRARHDIGLEARRRTSVILVRPTGAEERMHRVLQHYIRTVWREAVRRNDRGALLAMTVLWKRALSSAASLHVSVVRRLALLARGPSEPGQTTLPLDDGDPDLDSVDDVSARILATPGLDDARDERVALARVVDAAACAAAAESKLRCLVRLLSRVHEPVIVFTEYRDTLERLRSSLQAIGPVEMIHGGVPAVERERSCRRFSAGHARTLLATDAAGEGLNLQRSCRLVVNVELPWNPMRLEQRAGRVDRIGQLRRPHVVHLVARGTAEAIVQSRLHERVRRAESVIGPMQDPLGPCEDELAGHLLHIVTPGARTEGRARATTGARLSESVPPDLPGIAAAEASRHRGARRLLPARQRHRDASGPAARDSWLARELAWLEAQAPLATSLRCRPGVPRGTLAVFRIRIADASGWLVEDRLLPLHANGGSVPFEQPDGLEGGQGAAIDPRWKALGDWAAAAAADRATGIAEAVEQAIVAFTERERGLGRLRAIRRRAAQPGLFDVVRRPSSVDASHHHVTEFGAGRGLIGEAELLLVARIR